MEYLSWFGAYPKHKAVQMHSIDASPIIHFLRNRKYKIRSLSSFDSKANKEILLLKDDEERYWVSKNNYGELSSLLEHNFHNYIWYADIELEKGGYIKFHHGQLSVKMNNFSELKKITTKILDFYGYFASDEIWEFTCKHDQMLMIDIALGMEKSQITNEFSRMLEHNIHIEEDMKIIERELKNRKK